MIWWHCCIEMEDAEQRTEDVVATISRHILGWEQPGDRDAVIESHGTLKIRLTCTLMLKVLFFHALEYLDRLGCWCGSPKDYSNHWPSPTFMGNTAPPEKQENQVWVAQGKSTMLCHFGLLTALMKLIRTITFILLFEYPTTTTSSISWGVYREQRSLRRCHHVDNHWFLFGSYHVVSVRHTYFTFTIDPMLFYLPFTTCSHSIQ